MQRAPQRIVVVMLLCVRGYEIRDGKASSLETSDIAPRSGAPRQTIVALRESTGCESAQKRDLRNPQLLWCQPITDWPHAVRAEPLAIVAHLAPVTHARAVIALIHVFIYTITGVLQLTKHTLMPRSYHATTSNPGPTSATVGIRRVCLKPLTHVCNEGPTTVYSLNLKELIPYAPAGQSAAKPATVHAWRPNYCRDAGRWRSRHEGTCAARPAAAPAHYPAI